MSPDYPPQTIADSPRKGGYFLVGEPGRAQGSARPSLSLSLSFCLSLSSIFANWPLRFCTISVSLLLFCSTLALPLLPSCMFFFLLSFLSWKGISIREMKGTRESKGPFVVAHLWLLGPKRTILEEQESAQVLSRRAFVRLLSVINAKFDIPNASFT